MTHIEDIKKLLGTDKIIIGSERTLKELRKGTLTKIYLSTNPPSKVKEDIEHYAKLSDVEIINLPLPNDELGTTCRKPYPISVLGVKE